jgi:hypothetical protein
MDIIYLVMGAHVLAEMLICMSVCSLEPGQACALGDLLELLTPSLSSPSPAVGLRTIEHDDVDMEYAAK